MEQNDVLYETRIKITLDTSDLEDGSLSSKIQKPLKSLASEIDGSMEKSKQSAKGFSDSVLGIGESFKGLAETVKGFDFIGDVFGDITDSYNTYEAAMNGVAAVAKGTGNSVSESMQVIKDSTASGLLNQSDAAAAVKNLEQYGFTAQESADMINVLTDAAAYNRQANYSLSEAVRVTTEGIRMENSQLSDASGITTNIAKMYDNYAQSLGKSSNNLTQAEKKQAVLNGVMAEASIFSGNAAEYTNTLAGSQQRLNAQVETLKQSLGNMVSGILKPLIGGLADWLSENQALAIGIATFVGVLIGGGGLVYAIVQIVAAVKKVASAFMSMSLASQIATFGLLGIATAAAGFAVYYGLSTAMEKATSTTESLGDKSKKASADVSDLGGSADSSAKQIAKLNKQLEELDRDYERDLKELANRHQENLEDLTAQIEEANIDYRRAIDERVADFNVTMAKQEQSHQDTVDGMMTQLAFLQRYNNDYNQQKLAQVQFALNKEQELYKKQTEAQQAELELQNQADKEKLDARLEGLQAELDEELVFMDKHRDELSSVQHTILLDEVESLRERYEAQKASYKEQIAEAGLAGGSIADNFNTTLDDYLNTDYSQQGEDLGKSIIDGMWKGITEGLGNWLARGGIVGNIFEWIFGATGEKDLYNSIVDRNIGVGQLSYQQAAAYSTIGGATSVLRQKNSSARISSLTSSAMDNVRKYQYASGGYTGPGPKDEIAGVVHRGEYVVPAEDVDQSTGLPKATGGVQNVTINLSGTFATSQNEQRKVAMQIANALAQVNQARIS